jgi:hypothetical protein
MAGDKGPHLPVPGMYRICGISFTGPSKPEGSSGHVSGSNF